MLTSGDALLLPVFAAVARLGSFSAAASELHLSKSVVSERVKLLEEHAGAVLLERTTRRVRLTEAGMEVLDAANQIQDALGNLGRRLETNRREPAGTLRVATTNDLGPLLVGPAAARMVLAYPRVKVEIHAEDVQRDLMEAKVDVAVRMGAPKTSSFLMRKLATLDEPIVAAPAVAERLSAAKTPRDLCGAPWVKHSLVTGDALVFSGPGNAEEEVTLNVRAESSSGATVLSLLLHGAGVGVLPQHALREHLYHGRLVHLCPGWIWKQVTVFALMPTKSPRPAVRAFVDLLAEQISGDARRWGPPPAGRRSL